MNLNVETHLKHESGHLMKTLYHKDRLVGLQMINHKRNLPDLIPSFHIGSIKKDLRNKRTVQLSAHLGRRVRFGIPIDNSKGIKKEYSLE